MLLSISFFPKLFKENLVLITGIIGFTTGSLTASAYHRNNYNQQFLADRKMMLECQKAWEKYYSLTSKKHKPALNLTQQINSKIQLKSLTKKLNDYGWEIEEDYLESLINHGFNQGISIIAYEIDRLIPFTKYLAKYKETNHFSREEQRKRVYYS